MNSNRHTKEELRHDSFVDGTAKAATYLQTHFMTVLLVIAAVAVVVIGSVFFQQSRERSQLQAGQLLFRVAALYTQGAYGESLLQVAELEERFGHTDEGKSGVYFAGAAHLALAENDQAIERFQNYLNESSGGEYALASQVGLGLALEARGDLPGAVDAFREARESVDSEHPLATQAAISEARALQNLGRMDEAIAVLEPLRETADPQSVQEIESRLATLKALR